MRFLLDTNVIVPVEPTGPDGIEPGTATIASLLESLQRGGHRYSIHPATFEDVRRDGDAIRQAVRLTLLQKYHVLEAPPPLTREITDVLGYPEPGSNDSVDFRLLSAVASDCADYLVTHDDHLRRRARRVGLGERVITAAEALSAVRALFPSVPTPPPHVRAMLAHELDDNDQIFASLRADYSGFDAWLRKCKVEHRRVWTIDHDTAYAGLCIVNEENKPDLAPEQRGLKICTFKISERHRGYRYGELLLKAVFQYAQGNGFGFLFVEVFPRHAELCDLLSEFGFRTVSETHRGEFVMYKSMRPPEIRPLDLSPLDFHIRYGPAAFVTSGVDSYLVPIRPEYHSMLFPDAEAQLSLMEENTAFGNGMRKAYLSHSQTRTLSAGAIALFYRSQDLRGVKTIGVVEQTLISSSAAELARFVGKRTVYTFAKIEEFARRPTLAVLFRQALVLDTPWSLDLLCKARLVKAAPQSFVRLPVSACTWIQQQLARSY